jgi:phosphoribosylformylglycinamidine cyclo-ligase
MDYKDSGVDVEKGDAFVERIRSMVASTYDASVVSGVGGFAALYDLGDGRLLASGTDGVGTKVKIAQQLGLHNTIGHDLVGMCVNDVICTGARPMFFLDYFATGKLDLEVSTAVLEGITLACKESKCALIGGETAEMPGVYAPGVYDLAGFCVGEMHRDEWIDGSKIQPGTQLIGIRSSGFHSNGYSLIRSLVKNDETELLRSLLTPTRIYTRLVRELLSTQRGNILGIAHITGGGFQNIPRMNENCHYHITTPPQDHDRPAFMNEIVRRSGMSLFQSFETFNMGIGLVLAVSDPTLAVAALASFGETALLLGSVTAKTPGLQIDC